MKENICQIGKYKKNICRFRKIMFNKRRKDQVMDMLYKYKDAFSLRDEIGTCPNIEVEIDVKVSEHFSLDHIMLRKKIKI